MIHISGINFKLGSDRCLSHRTSHGVLSRIGSILKNLELQLYCITFTLHYKYIPLQLYEFIILQLLLQLYCITIILHYIYIVLYWCSPVKYEMCHVMMGPFPNRVFCRKTSSKRKLITFLHWLHSCIHSTPMHIYILPFENNLVNCLSCNQIIITQL